MKTMIKGLLVLFGLTNSVVSADALREADDIYIGFQITTSLDSIFSGLFSGDHQYNYLFVQQRNGIRDGIVLTQDNHGHRTLNYLRPSNSFDIGQSRIVEYAVPIMQLEAQDSHATDQPGSGKSGTNASAALAVAGLAALVAIPWMIKRDLEKDWERTD